MTEDRSSFEPEPASDPQLPRRLVDDLAATSRRRVYVPEAVDRAVLEVAAAHLRPIRARRRRRLFAAASTGLAAAAALALGVTLWLADPAAGPAPAAPQYAARLAEDVDGNGTIDVRDAFLVARHLERADVNPPAAWDVTGDGRIDRQDVDAIAQRAVRLNGEHG